MSGSRYRQQCHFRRAATAFPPGRPVEDALLAKVIKADFRKAAVDGAIHLRPEEERVFVFDRASGLNVSLA